MTSQPCAIFIKLEDYEGRDEDADVIIKKNHKDEIKSMKYQRYGINCYFDLYSFFDNTYSYLFLISSLVLDLLSYE